MELRVLGPVGIADGGRVVSLGSARVRTILAALVLEADRVVAVDELAEAVWGGAPPRTARNQVQIAISSLRTALASVSQAAADALVTQPNGYVLRLAGGVNGAIRCDLHEFRRLAEAGDVLAAKRDLQGAHRSYADALAHWRGPVCQDVESPRVQLRAALVTRERQTVDERRIGLDVLLGRPDQVIGELVGLLDADPMRERLWYLLMLARAEAGHQSAALDTYRQARATLVAELGLEPGADLRMLELAVLRGDLAPARSTVEEWLGPAEAGSGSVGGGGPAWLTPRQLPAGTTDFVGRRAELDRLTTLLRAGASVDTDTDTDTGTDTGADTNADTNAGATGGRTVVAISGLGGAGKTTLAVHAAAIAEAFYPDGCVFIDLQGTDPAAVDAFTGMGSLLLSLGIPAAAIPGNAQARTGMYRSVIAQRRLLIVLDNASDEAQIGPLLPGAPGSAALVTSRRTLTALEGVHGIELGGFARDEALDLLVSILGMDRIDADRAAADRIIELCDGLPLAVRLVGMRLVHRPEVPLAHMAGRLSDERDRLDELATGGRELRASIAVGVAQLDAEAAQLLRRIAMVPAPEIQAWVAAALLGVRMARAERVLDRLRQTSLLAVAPLRTNPPYRPHDLVRLYARERAAVDEPEAEISAALHRVYETLLRSARDADARLGTVAYPMPPLPDPQWTVPDPIVVVDAKEWFRANGALLLGAVHDCLARGWLELAWHLAVSPAHAFSVIVFEYGWLTAMESVRAALATDPANRFAEAAVTLALGGLERERGEGARAYAYLRRARLLFRATGDDYRAAMAATQLAMSARVAGRIRIARAAAAWAIAVYERSPNPIHDGWAYVAMGNLLVDASDLDGADAAYASALAAMRRAHDAVGETTVLICIGMLRDRQGRYDEASEYLRAGRELGIRSDTLIDVGASELALGRLEMRRGRLDGALEWVEMSLASVREVGFRLLEANVLRIYAELMLLLDRPADAVSASRTSVEIATDVGWAAVRGQAGFTLARALFATGDHDGARDAAQAALAVLTSMGHHVRQEVADWLAANGA
jgi:DNA-binding SARP family transcriptional activator/tetratricopeptide (TPR) repeat protein